MLSVMTSGRIPSPRSARLPGSVACSSLPSPVMCCALSRLRATVSQGITILPMLLLCLNDLDSMLAAIEVPPGFGTFLQYHIERLNILHSLLLQPATQSG